MQSSYGIDTVHDCKDRAKMTGASNPKLINEGGTALIFSSDDLVYKVYMHGFLENTCSDFLCFTQLWDHYPKFRKHLPKIYAVDARYSVIIKEYVPGGNWLEVNNTGKMAIKYDTVIDAIKSKSASLGWRVFDLSDLNVIWTGKDWVVIDFYAVPVTEETEKTVMDCMLSVRNNAS